MGNKIRIKIGLPMLIAFLSLMTNLSNAQITNTPPRLMANNWVYALAGKEVAITQTNLLTVDQETTDPVEIVYQVFPGETNVVLENGGVYVGAKLLKGNDTFTQEDINAGRVKWRSANTVRDEGVGIPFRVRDFDGAYAADGLFTVFSIRIKHLNTPPTPVEGFTGVPLSAEAVGTVAGNDTELFQTLSFSIVEPPLKGTISQLDTNSGKFTYMANSGASGEDTFKFQVYDGVDYATNAGIHHLNITNYPPAITQQTFRLKQYGSLDATVLINNPDQVDQKLTLSLLVPPQKGVFQSFDTNSGKFVYIPNSGRMGYDSFVVSASDGFLQSLPQTNIIMIEAVPSEGLLWVLGKTQTSSQQTASSGIIYLLNPANGDTALFMEANFLREMRAMQYDSRRHELYIAGDVKSDTNSVNVLGAINIDTMKVRTISMGDKLAFPIAIDLDADKNFLLANGPGGLLRVDPDANTITTVIPPSDTFRAVIGSRPENSGSIIVLDAINLFANDGRILRFDPVTGSASSLSTDARLFDPTDTLVLPDGKFLLLDRNGLFEVKNDFTSLTELIPAVAFKGLAKEMQLFNGTNLLLLDMQVELMKFDLVSGARTNLGSDIPIIPISFSLHKQPITHADWRSNYFRPSELADLSLETTKWGDLADPDNDGHPNFVEFSLGLNPLQSEKTGYFQYNIQRESGATIVNLTFQRRQSLGNIKCEPESTSNLKDWTVSEFKLLHSEKMGSALERVTYQLVLSDEGKTTARFFRLKINR